MDDCTPNARGDAPTRREFGRRLAAATVLPAMLPRVHGAGSAAPSTDRAPAVYVPEDTYPYFTEADPAPTDAPGRSAPARHH